MQPPTADRQFRNMVVRIAELTVNTSELEGLEFSNCRIMGPAILIPLGTTSILHCALGGPDLDALFWEITPQRQSVVGAVAALDCTFSGCQFDAIGWAGPSGLREMFASG